MNKILGYFFYTLPFIGVYLFMGLDSNFKIATKIMLIASGVALGIVICIRAATYFLNKEK